MSMDITIVGFRPADDKWRVMKTIYEQCEEIGVPIPKEVLAFFDHQAPDESGVRVEIADTECCREYSNDYESGYEIDVTKLPKDVTIIRAAMG